MRARNRVGTEYGIESLIAHEILILEGEIDLSNTTCVCPLSSLFFIQEESIPVRNEFHGGIDSS
jgi:hypothetical protein